MLLVFELRQVLYVLLVAGLLGLGSLIWAVNRRSAPRQDASGSKTPSLLDALHEAPLGMMILEDQDVRYLNAEARELLHLPEGPATQLPLTDWVDLLQEDRTAVRQEANEESGFGAPRVGGRVRTVTFASGHTVRWWVAALPAADVVILLDISTQQRVTQAGRSLISDLGHELRTPIATLLTHLEILKLDDVGEQVRRQSLYLAREEAQRMSRLVNDMLELGRLEMTETLSRRPINLMKLVEEAVVQMTPQAAERGIDLDVLSGGTLPLVAGNADRLRQVLLNLLDNAVKYAGTSSRVTVSLESIEDGVRCAVCDTGPGIAPEHLPHITRRFYRASPDTVEGTGLGLALVEEILRRHDTTLDIISPVVAGRGTCVQFALPAVEPLRSVQP